MSLSDIVVLQAVDVSTTDEESLIFEVRLPDVTGIWKLLDNLSKLLNGRETNPKNKISRLYGHTRENGKVSKTPAYISGYGLKSDTSGRYYTLSGSFKHLIRNNSLVTFQVISDTPEADEVANTLTWENLNQRDFDGTKLRVVSFHHIFAV